MNLLKVLPLNKRSCSHCLKTWNTTRRSLVRNLIFHMIYVNMGHAHQLGHWLRNSKIESFYCNLHWDREFIKNHNNEICKVSFITYTTRDANSAWWSAPSMICNFWLGRTLANSCAATTGIMVSAPPWTVKTLSYTPRHYGNYITSLKTVHFPQQITIIKVVVL